MNSCSQGNSNHSIILYVFSEHRKFSPRTAGQSVQICACVALSGTACRHNAGLGPDTC